MNSEIRSMNWESSQWSMMSEGCWMLGEGCGMLGTC